ncbi:BTAD domain-containing putative transcriptional regulator [Streptomyces sp. NPDC056452]|uniref:AfsR/SARP family transcriptional regulator n=1 Tax=Streptomyces sp. NPDC056452 TaxID=3345821 RepID=UPI0036B0F375
MCFRVLGSLEVLGGAVTITAQRQRIVLATLLLNANRVVPLERLIRAVWDGNPPTTAHAQVQTAISAIRRSLSSAGLGGSIQTRGRGYVIEVKPGQLDLHVFTELVARGRAATSLEESRAAFREALSLCYGEPLSGLDSGVVRAVAIRMEEQRIEVLEECIEAELGLGLHHQVVGEIKALAAEHPLRERLAGQLITALYRDGRQAEALAAYRKVHQAFIHELGLEPSASLRQLEHMILTGGAGMDLPSASRPAPPSPSTPRVLPPRTPDFTGRAEVFEALRRQLAGGPPDTPGRGVPHAAVIAGGAGTGKSALAAQLAHELAPAFPDGQLHAVMPRGAGREEGVRVVLETLLGDLGHPASAIPADRAERLALFHDAIAGRRLLVVVDAVVDEEQIRALAPSAPGSRLLVTSRARPSALAGVCVYELDAMSTAEGIDLLSRTIGHGRVTVEPSEALELVELCGGLPLALSVAATRLAARPHWMLSDITERLRHEDERLEVLTYQGIGVLPMQESVCESLTPPARRLLLRLALLETDDFAAWVADPLLDLDHWAALDVLESLVDARLVEVGHHTGTAARYRLDGLTRIYARGMLAREEPAAERTAAQERILAAWLHLADEARRRNAVGHEVPYDLMAPEVLPEAIVNSVLADPSSWYEAERASLLAIVRQRYRSGNSAYCWNLALMIGSLSEALYHYDDWRESHQHALAVARQGKDRLGEAALLHSLGTLDLRERCPDRAQAQFDLALSVFEQLGETRWCRLVVRSLEEMRRLKDAQSAASTEPDRAGDSTRTDRTRPALPRVNLPGRRFTTLRGGADGEQARSHTHAAPPDAPGFVVLPLPRPRTVPAHGDGD